VIPSLTYSNLLGTKRLGCCCCCIGRLLDSEELKIHEVHNWKQELRPKPRFVS
jgi:hypothetical protein